MTKLQRRARIASATMVLLALIASLAAAATVWTLNEDARALDRLGGQRMMAQRAALLAHRLSDASVPMDVKDRLTVELASIRQKMRQDIRELAADSQVPDDIAALLSVAWDGETGVMARFDQALLRVLDGTGAAEDVNDREAMLFSEETGRRYRRHMESEVFAVQAVVWGGLSLMFVGVAALHFGLFRPAVEAVEREGELQIGLSEAVGQSGLAVLLMNDHGRVQFSNPQAQLLLGRTRSELEGMDWADLVFRSYGEDLQADIIDASRHEPWRGDLRLLQSTGAVLWAETVAAPATADGGRLVLFFDAAAKREAEIKLRQARERLGAAIDAIDDGFALFDADERYVMSNRRFIVHFPDLEPWLIPGAAFSELIDRMWKLRLVDSDKTLDEFSGSLKVQYRAAAGHVELPLTNGRRLWFSLRRTPEGGRVLVASDVTLLRAGGEQLRRALAAAEQADRAKTVFLSSMSHELRTPLNAVLGFAQLLDATPDGVFGDKQRRSVSHVLRAGQSLSTMIEQVLDLADLQSGGGRIQLTDVDLVSVVQECADVVRENIAEKGMVLQLELPPPPLTVRADRERLAQALHCLLSNAVKFNKPEGRIVVRVERPDGGMVRLAVVDSGSGIDDPEAVFQPFVKLGAANVGPQGLGIGLTLARSVAERMGGRLTVAESQSGAAFLLELHLAGGDSAALAHKGRILLVGADGAADMDTLYRCAPNVETTSVADLDDAGRIEDLAAYDCIIVDLPSRRFDPIEVRQSLRISPKARFVPVFAMIDDSEDSSTAQAIGVDGVLPKPLTASSITDLVKRYCRLPG